MENKNRKALSWSASLAVHATGAILILVAGFHIATPEGTVTDKTEFEAVSPTADVAVPVAVAAEPAPPAEAPTEPAAAPAEPPPPQAEEVQPPAPVVDEAPSKPVRETQPTIKRHLLQLKMLQLQTPHKNQIIIQSRHRQRLQRPRPHQHQWRRPQQLPHQLKQRQQTRPPKLQGKVKFNLKHRCPRKLIAPNNMERPDQ